MARKSVTPNWNKELWKLLEDLARVRGREVELRMSWPGVNGLWFDVRLSDGKPRAVIDERVIALLEKVDQDALGKRLIHDKERQNWPVNAARMRASLGSTTSLTFAASVIGAALQQRATLSVDIHQSLAVDKESLRPLLPPEAMAKVDAEERLFTLRRLAEILGIAVFKPEMAVAADTVAQDDEEEEQEDEIGVSDDDDDDEEDSPVWQSRNVIFFGPPGTGKSHQLDELVRNHLGVRGQDRVLRVTFHPEYTYFDFVGNYRPAVGWLTSTGGASFKPEEHNAPPRAEEPRVYFMFDPGPLSIAIRAAAADARQNVVLIIEEINRGNCAAIFGDVFQLLDRKSDLEAPSEYGLSQYPINPTAAWSAWLSQNLQQGSAAWSDGKLRLPRNLFIYATMNTSDQSLFPIDTAFRRRWSMQYVGVESGSPQTLVPIQHDQYVRWAELMRPLNRAIVEHTGTDDKQIGPWFLRARGADQKVEPQEFASKLLFYLWADVFRDAPEKLFGADLHTYDQLVRAYLKEKRSIFSKEIMDELRPATATSPPVAEAAPASLAEANPTSVAG